MNTKFWRGLLLACFVLLSGPALAFRSVDVESYSDPDYTNYQPKKVMLVVNEASQEMRTEIQERLVKELKRKGVVAVPERDVFPPTREYTPEDRAKVLESQSIDSVLVVSVGASASSMIPVATNTYGTVHGSATPTSSGGYNVSGTTAGTSQNLYAAKSKSEFSAVLLDAKQGRVAWYADVQVKAAGMLFVGEAGDAKGAVGGIIEGMEKNGLVAK